MDSEIQTTLHVAAVAVGIFDDIGIPLVVVGSVAGMVHQHTRRTHDIDLLADVRPAHVQQLTQTRAGEWDVPAGGIQDALDQAHAEAGAAALIITATAARCVASSLSLLHAGWAQRPPRSSARPALAAMSFRRRPLLA